VLKNFQQLFYMQRSNILSNSFIQFIVFPDAGPFRPKTYRI
jgi:hypothetical protein